MHSRRLVLKKLPNKHIVKILFDEISPKYSERPGGYTRIEKLGFRENDRSPVSIIEFVDLFDKSSEIKEKENEVS